jgi:hypothetical protein
MSSYHYDDRMIDMYQLGTVYANALLSNDEKVVKMVQEYMRMKQTWREEREQA